MPDLSTALLVGTVDDDELALVLGALYGHVVNDYPSVHYSRNGDGPDVTLTYANRRVASVSTGAHWDAADLHLLREKLTEGVFSGEARIGRCVLMAAQPLRGYVELGSAGRLLPAPADAPRPNSPIGNCEPLLYEFAYESSPDLRIDELRRQRVVLSTRTIVNVLLNGGLTQCSGFSASSDVFSPIDRVNRAPVISDAEHFSRIDRPPGEELALPASFSKWLAAYKGLSADDRERFLRAANCFDHAGATRTNSYSAALIALVTAIECLMPRPEGRVFCRECKHEKGDGPTKRFMTFVTSHAQGGDAVERYVKDLYKTRSALAHGWQLSMRDRDAALWRLHPANSEENRRADGAMMLARGILLSWLASRQPRSDL